MKLSLGAQVVSLSDQLRVLILTDHRPLDELAELAAVRRSMLSRFVAGKRTITLETADRLAAVLELRIVSRVIGGVSRDGTRRGQAGQRHR
jgi:transcriptional regulator with XRE-family HTH domain